MYLICTLLSLLPSSPQDHRGGKTWEPHSRSHGEEAEPYMSDMWEEFCAGSLPHISPAHSFQEGWVRQMPQMSKDVHFRTHTEGRLVDRFGGWVWQLVGGWWVGGGWVGVTGKGIGRCGCVDLVWKEKWVGKSWLLGWLVGPYRKEEGRCGLMSWGYRARMDWDRLMG